MKISGDPASNAPVGSLSKAMELGLFEGAIPTRSWKPGKVWVARDGIFGKTGKCLSAYAPFESSLEAIAHLLLSTDSRIKSYVCQPPALHYWLPNAEGGQDERSYTPDFVALTRDDRMVAIDAKASIYARSEKWLKREPFIRRAYRRDHGVELLVWTEEDLLAEPRLSNASTLYRHRFASSDPTIEAEVIGELESCGGESSIGKLCDALSARQNVAGSEFFGAIMRQALEGTLRLNADVPYNRETSVRISEASK